MKKLWFLALVPLVLSGQACNTYSYFDIDMKVGAGFDVVTIGRIFSCHMFITGAATDDFNLGFTPCHNINTGTRDIGKIQYSTFADSGNVTFTLRLFERMESDACQIGVGATTLAVDKSKTVAGELTAPYTPPGCPQ